MRKKLVTIQGIARRLGISHMTVSRALSLDPKVSTLVTETTRKTGGRNGLHANLLAKTFVTGKTDTFGLLTYKIFREMFSRQTDQILRVADCTLPRGPGAPGPRPHRAGQTGCRSGGAGRRCERCGLRLRWASLLARVFLPTSANARPVAAA